MKGKESISSPLCMYHNIAIHRSIGQFIATADEDIYLKESEAESGKGIYKC